MLIPVNLFTWAASIIPFIYVATHIGAKEHAGWIFSKETLLIILIAIILFCVGIDGQGIWNTLVGWTHH